MIYEDSYLIPDTSFACPLPDGTGTANGHAGHPPAEHRTHRFGHGAGRLE